VPENDIRGASNALNASGLLINIDREYSRTLNVNEANKYYLTGHHDLVPPAGAAGESSGARSLIVRGRHISGRELGQDGGADAGARRSGCRTGSRPFPIGDERTPFSDRCRQLGDRRRRQRVRPGKGFEQGAVRIPTVWKYSIVRLTSDRDSQGLHLHRRGVMWCILHHRPTPWHSHRSSSILRHGKEPAPQ
jgi:hypothetical protein